MAQILTPVAGAVGGGDPPAVDWRAEDALSSPRYALAAATASDGSIFAIGGAGGASVTGVVEVYTPRTRQWKAGPSLPHPRYRHAAATGGDGRVYAIGGNSPGAEGAFLSSVLALTPGDDHWVPLAPMPTGRQLLAATAGTDGRVYAVGGHRGDSLATLEIYDPTVDRWATGASMPTPRNDMGVAGGPDGRIYAIGGCGDGLLNALDIVEAYSPATDSWTTLAPLPSRRCLVDATTGPDGRIYAIGGCELVTDATGAPVDCVDTTRVDAYSPDTDTWETVTGTTVAHREGAAVTSGRRIFAIGGHTTAVESARVTARHRVPQPPVGDSSPDPQPPAEASRTGR
ncbi:Kelch repeat-containing protein [Micromonospora sp. BQ11]|uniref:Kelch repeat-containing protein n=1 Tax=Micromonospora sp. BQ11 TaxID=3452212 RepID=UPI003F88E042